MNSHRPNGKSRNLNINSVLDFCLIFVCNKSLKRDTIRYLKHDSFAFWIGQVDFWKLSCNWFLFLNAWVQLESIDAFRGVCQWNANRDHSFCRWTKYERSTTDRQTSSGHHNYLGLSIGSLAIRLLRTRIGVWKGILKKLVWKFVTENEKHGIQVWTRKNGITKIDKNPVKNYLLRDGWRVTDDGWRVTGDETWRAQTNAHSRRNGWPPRLYRLWCEQRKVGRKHYDDANRV